VPELLVFIDQILVNRLEDQFKVESFNGYRFFVFVLFWLQQLDNNIPEYSIFGCLEKR
jgi:hypothetical protein